MQLPAYLEGRFSQIFVSLFLTLGRILSEYGLDFLPATLWPYGKGAITFIYYEPRCPRMRLRSPIGLNWYSRGHLTLKKGSKYHKDKIKVIKLNFWFFFDHKYESTLLITPLWKGSQNRKKVQNKNMILQILTYSKY